MGIVKIVIGGDVFPKKAHDLFINGKVESVFDDKILALFRQADFSICNLEGALTNSIAKIPKYGPNIKAPPETAAGIKKLGVDYVTLANNHVTDFGVEGYDETCQTLKKFGIGFFGAGENIYSITTHVRIQIKGKTFIFYGVSETVANSPKDNFPGVNLYDEYKTTREIQELKRSCDYLFVLYHGGAEYFRFPTPWIKKRFHRMAESGADFVIAQHTHCIGTKEDYNGAYLLYGQGNFYFHQKLEKDVTSTGLLLEVDFVGSSIDVKHHLIYLDKDMAKYDDKQDLTDFVKRSQRLKSGDGFEKEFSQYCEKWTLHWLSDFRGNNFWDKVLKRILSKEQYNNYLRRNYKDIHIARMLTYVKGEEFSEVMQEGLFGLYQKNKENK